MAIEQRPDQLPHQDSGVTKLGKGPSFPRPDAVETGIETIELPTDISKSLAGTDIRRVHLNKRPLLLALSGTALILGLGVAGAAASHFSDSRVSSRTPIDNAPISGTAPEPDQKLPGLVEIPPTKVEPSTPPPPPVEVVKAPENEPHVASPNTFFSDSSISLKGQPSTVQGIEHTISGIRYTDIQGAEIKAPPGYFSLRKNMANGEILGATVIGLDGVPINYTGPDFIFKDLRSRPLEQEQAILKVGVSGKLTISSASLPDPITGQYITPQEFFTNNFDPSVLKKPKIVAPRAGGVVAPSSQTSISIIKEYQ